MSGAKILDGTHVQVAVRKPAMASQQARPLEERVAERGRTGILDEQGVLSSRYGGPGQMTEPHEAEEASR